MKTVEAEEFQDINNEEKEEAVVEVKRPPTFTKEQEADMFKQLAHKSYKQVGYDNGLQYYYKTDPQLRTALMNIFRRIRKAPELWGISTDLVEVIDEATASRSIKQNPRLQSEIAIENESFRDKLETMRDTLADIIKKKLDKLMKQKGGIDTVSFRDLKDMLAMTIDKSRLLRGESTENITKISKLDTESLSPDDALKVIMKARDAMIEARK